MRAPVTLSTTFSLDDIGRYVCNTLAQKVLPPTAPVERYLDAAAHQIGTDTTVACTDIAENPNRKACGVNHPTTLLGFAILRCTGFLPPSPPAEKATYVDSSVAPHAPECLGACVVCRRLHPQLQSNYACATRQPRKHIGRAHRVATQVRDERRR